MENSIEVKIKAKLSVDRQTAETCLKLVEMYVNEKDACIITEKKASGERKYRFEHYCRG